MSDTAAEQPAADDPAAIGFAMLMTDVETAVSAASDEIRALARVVQQGIGNPPAASPPPPAPPVPRHPATPPDTAAPAESRRAPGDRSASMASAPPARPAAPGVAPQRAEAQMAPNAARDPAEPVAREASPAPALAPALAQAPVAPSVPPVRPVPVVRIMRAEAALPPAVLALPAAPSSPAPRSAVPQPAPVTRPAIAPEPDAMCEQATVAPIPPDETAALPPPLAPQGLPGVNLAAAPARRAEGAAPAVSATSAAAPPSMGWGAGAPMHGDVFLDGVRVGHWMSETLARAAAGPGRGGTGHDSLMGPRWPGALQGR